MLKTDEDGEFLCPQCGKVLSGAYIERADGVEVVYQHSDFAARAFTDPCIVVKESHAEAIAALNEFPSDWNSLITTRGPSALLH